MQLCEEVGEGTAAPAVVPQLSFSYKAPRGRDRVLTRRAWLPARSRCSLRDTNATSSNCTSEPTALFCLDLLTALRTSLKETRPRQK